MPYESPYMGSMSSFGIHGHEMCILGEGVLSKIYICNIKYILYNIQYIGYNLQCMYIYMLYIYRPPGKTVAHNVVPLRLNFGPPCGIVACSFGLLGFQGSYCGRTYPRLVLTTVWSLVGHSRTLCKVCRKPCELRSVLSILGPCSGWT